MIRALALALALSVFAAHAQETPASGTALPRLVSFEFEREGLKVPHWGIEVNGDGSGTYWEQAPVSERTPDGRVVRPLKISQPTLEKLQAGNERAATQRCETRSKNIANTGRKTLTAPGGACVFNYSDDKAVTDAADAFQSIAETMQAGARLERKRRFDRLGLDAEMISLNELLKSGRAIELANIAPILRVIANDTDVLERVRTRAARWVAEMQ